MSKLLFKEIPSENNEYIKNNKWIKVFLLVTAIIFLTLGIISLFFGGYILLIAMGIFAAMIFYIYVRLIRQERQYLYIYEDKICYRKAFPKTEKQICISPDLYQIKLRRNIGNNGYSAKFIFVNLQGEKLFEYKAVSLWPSLYQAEKNQWEIDLFNIGCNIINDQEVIKNT